MAIHHTCDGCGKDIEGSEIHTYGLVRTADYCATCAADVLRFVKARNDLHSAIAADWQHRVELLKKEFLDAHLNGRLPD